MEPAREEVETSFKEPNTADVAGVSTRSESSDKGSVTHGAGGPVNSDVPFFPVLYPTLVPTLLNMPNQEAVNNGAGIYAVTTSQLMGPFAGFPPNTLIPLTYSVPTRPAPGAAATGEEQGQVGQQQQQQQQQQGPQRQVVVRRFQIAIQLDLLLILKLAAVIFLFNQDGSRQRLILLVFFASLVYLYQTGALTPLVRWLSQGMQRAAAPPRPAAARADNNLPAIPGNDNAARPDGQAEEEAQNENQPLLDGNQAAGENEHVVAPPAGAENGGGNNNRWWGIVKEVQMIVFGFITSLLPGFHNIEQQQL